VSEPLYTLDILRLAAATASLPRIDGPHGIAEKRSPVCGSRVTIEVDLDAGGIARLGGAVSACAFGQASTALLAQSAVGRNGADLARATEALHDYLKGAREDPGDWPGLAIFDRARAHPGRHAAILLPFEAARDAVAKAGAG
jgi:NifU-like protein involved in Fe-S cluster formation